MKLTRIVLDVVWDEYRTDPPEQWDWLALCDLSCDEKVSIFEYEELPVPKEKT